LNIADVGREVRRAGIVATISDKTVWRWLHDDAIRPWQHRAGILARDPAFAVNAGRNLDLYARQWPGRPLDANEFLLSTDEKTSSQARVRIHPSTPPAPGRSMRVEHEYRRGGAWGYLAGLDVHRAKIFGRCEPTTFPTLVPVHGPIHASWLNQIEIYFSILQRNALTPNDFGSLADVGDRLVGFERYYESMAAPFDWRFTKHDLHALVAKLSTAADAFGSLRDRRRCRTYEPVYLEGRSSHKMPGRACSCTLRWPRGPGRSSGSSANSSEPSATTARASFQRSAFRFQRQQSAAVHSEGAAPSCRVPGPPYVNGGRASSGGPIAAVYVVMRDGCRSTAPGNALVSWLFSTTRTPLTTTWGIPSG
jgi:hypothetical protein